MELSNKQLFSFYRNAIKMVRAIKNKSPKDLEYLDFMSLPEDITVKRIIVNTKNQIIDTEFKKTKAKINTFLDSLENKYSSTS
jgi:hypothetical protein